MPFPTLSELRVHLKVPAVNTGLRIELTGPSGIITDDMEGLLAEQDGEGRIRLLSGVEFSTYMYRGQTSDFGSCTPTLARLKNPAEQLLALCQCIAFEDAISNHPMVQLAERTQICGSPLYVDREGLAQHYEQATDMLDISSNFDVAVFFATCHWNATESKFEPFYSNKPGVLYRINSVIFDMACQQNTSDEILRVVGWQPLPRPEHQRAHVIQLRSGQDLNQLPGVEMFRFSHDTATSQNIFKIFNQGNELFPTDATAELSHRAKDLSKFTDAQIEMAWQRLNAWNGELSTSELKARIESQCGIQRTAAPILNWNGLLDNITHDQLQAQLNEVLNRIRCRRAWYI